MYKQDIHTTMVVLLGWGSSKEEISVSINEVDNAEAMTAMVGLRILVQQLLHQQQLNQYPSLSSNIVLRSSNLTKSSKFALSNIISGCSYDYYDSSCFIKFCCLCKRKLRLDKDMYMYKGDQGFCSVVCRERRIYLDDIQDLEASIKKDLSSSGHCSVDGGTFRQGFDRNHSLSDDSKKLVLFY